MLARIEKDNMEISSYDKSHTYNLWLSLIKYVAVVAIAVGVGWGIKKFREIPIYPIVKKRKLCIMKYMFKKEDVLIR